MWNWLTLLYLACCLCWIIVIANLLYVNYFFSNLTTSCVCTPYHYNVTVQFVYRLRSSVMAEIQVYLSSEFPFEKQIKRVQCRICIGSKITNT